MPRGGERFVATVLFTDVVGSTELAAEVGDRRWNAILGVYYEAARREVKRFRGREIDTAGDGFFAAFDAPNDGVRAATAIVESMWARGIPIRAGLHAGECEVVGKKVGGIAVHIGARVAGLAGAGEVVVTSTVRDLAAGSALKFEPLGARELKGVPGEWSVFEVESAQQRPTLPPIDVPDPSSRRGDGGRRRTALFAGIAAAVVAVAVAVPLLLLGGSNDEKNPQGAGQPSVTGGNTTGTGPASPPAGSGSAGPTTAPPVGVLSFDAETGEPGEPIPIEGLTESTDPEGHTVTSGFGFVWVADFYGNAVYKINPETDSIVAKLSVVYPSSMYVDGSDVWVASGFSGCVRCQIVHIDATTNKQVDAIDLDVCCGGMVIDHGKLWALAANRLFRLDVETSKVEEFPVGGDAITAGDGKVWVLSRALATLIPVDQSTGKVGDPIALPGTSPTLVTYAFDALWVTDRAEGVVTRIPVGGRGGTEDVEVGPEPTGIAASKDAMWVANTGDGTVTKLDPFDASAVNTVGVGGRPTRITVAFGSVWVTNVPPHTS
jgi:class 3 adenylate cyclase